MRAYKFFTIAFREELTSLRLMLDMVYSELKATPGGLAEAFKMCADANLKEELVDDAARSYIEVEVTTTTASVKYQTSKAELIERKFVLPSHQTNLVLIKKLSDEPVFVLTGRDPQAPELVKNWAIRRAGHILSGKQVYSSHQLKKSIEALDVAAKMEFWKNENPDYGVSVSYGLPNEASVTYALSRLLKDTEIAGIVTTITNVVNPNTGVGILNGDCRWARHSNGKHPESSVKNYSIAVGGRSWGNVPEPNNYLIGWVMSVGADGINNVPYQSGKQYQHLELTTSGEINVTCSVPRELVTS